MKSSLSLTIDLNFISNDVDIKADFEKSPNNDSHLI
jgi:hypothetical protein